MALYGVPYSKKEGKGKSCAAEQPPAGTESAGPASVRKASEKMYYLACETKLSESQEAKPGRRCTSSKVLVSIFNSTRVHSSAPQETSTVHDQASVCDCHADVLRRRWCGNTSNGTKLSKTCRQTRTPQF